LTKKRSSVAPPEVITKCARCHGDTGRNTYKNVPNLAGQQKQYLENQLRALWESGLVPNDPLIIRKRSYPFMSPHALFLSDEEVRALADYFSTRVCR